MEAMLEDRSRGLVARARRVLRVEQDQARHVAERRGRLHVEEAGVDTGQLAHGGLPRGRSTIVSLFVPCVYALRPSQVLGTSRQSETVQEPSVMVAMVSSYCIEKLGLPLMRSWFRVSDPVNDDWPPLMVTSESGA